MWRWYSGALPHRWGIACAEYGPAIVKNGGKLGDKLATLSEPDALALLAGNGNLVKRPFLIGDGLALTGFDAKRWAEVLGRK